MRLKRMKGNLMRLKTGCAALAILALMVGGFASPSFSKTYTLKVAHVFAPDHPWEIGLRGLAEDVKKASEGRLIIETFPSSQLGGDRDVAEGLQLGSIEMGLFGTGALQVLDPRMIIEELPYAWPTREHAYKALDGQLGEALLKIIAEKGIIGISWWESGYRHITNSRRPINTVDDLSGLKLRVPEARMRIDTFKLLGASPTPMAFSEVFTGLQQRVVDGQENPLATIWASRFYEVQEHLALSKHIWGSGLLAVSKHTWQVLPDDLKKILVTHAENWKEKNRKMIAKGDDEFLAKLKETGIKVTEPDTAPFQKAVQPLYAEYEKVFGKDLMDLVRKYSSMP